LKSLRMKCTKEESLQIVGDSSPQAFTFPCKNDIIFMTYKECARDKLDDRTATCLLGKVLKLDRWAWICF